MSKDVKHLRFWCCSGVAPFSRTTSLEPSTTLPHPPRFLAANDAIEDPQLRIIAHRQIYSGQYTSLSAWHRHSWYAPRACSCTFELRILDVDSNHESPRSSHQSRAQTWTRARNRNRNRRSHVLQKRRARGAKSILQSLLSDSYNYSSAAPLLPNAATRGTSTPREGNGMRISEITSTYTLPLMAYQRWEKLHGFLLDAGFVPEDVVLRDESGDVVNKEYWYWVVRPGSVITVEGGRVDRGRWEGKPRWRWFRRCIVGCDGMEMGSRARDKSWSVRAEASDSRVDVCEIGGMGRRVCDEDNDDSAGLVRCRRRRGKGDWLETLLCVSGLK